MAGIADSIARLARAQAAGPYGTPLVALDDFGTNPGALAGYHYMPATMADPGALVVVLHGCTQTAAGFDHGAGWSTLAERHGFALLFPEQTRRNNPNLCFNWFNPEDIRRDSGEALSIRQMIGAMVARYPIDPARIFVTGLSAGGAMASVMLATYPELFAGGAIIAGLPYGTAATVPQALERMRGAGPADERALAAAVRDASPHRGPWPAVSVWHGSADATVNQDNADAVVAQWRALHGLAAAPTRSDVVAGHQHRQWCDEAGRPVVEEYRVAGMGHGVPLAASGEDGCGVAGAYMLEAGLSSTCLIAEGWGLASAAVVAPAGSGNGPRPAATPTEEPAAAVPPSAGARVSPVGQVINDALRAAGLLR
jgi:poly(hydroxyalkanoate) depolymerase family esterase